MASHNPIILLANHHQFAGRDKIIQPCVISRPLLWCKAGNGTITINGAKHEMQPGKVLLLPWKSSITYEAAAQHPFLIGGVHLIPDHDRAVSPVFQIAHQVGDPLAISTARKDAPLKGLSGFFKSEWSVDTPLFLLAEYAVNAFRRETPTEQHARHLADLLINEMALFFGQANHKQSTDNHPDLLRQSVQFILTHLHEPLSLDRLIRFSGSSASTLCRLFKEHYTTSPVNFILDTKMERARQLLLTSHLSIAKIGITVGIDDPYYFSKLFKNRLKESPREYRKRRSLV